MDGYSLSDGETLVKNARYTIDLFLKSPQFKKEIIEDVLEKYKEKHGIFVTLEHYPTMSQRGSTGFSSPSGPVSRLLVEAAIAAASDDEKFVSMSHNELQETTVEVSVLSDLVHIEKRAPEARKKEIKLGRDGLMIHYGFKKGIILPKTALEKKWNKEQLLDNLCEKAGLPAGSWKRPDVTLYRFTTQTFKEMAPDGEVREVRTE